jgi:hypothetical protein
MSIITQSRLLNWGLLLLFIVIFAGTILLRPLGAEILSSASSFEMPKFEQIVVADKLQDAYWIDSIDINQDSRPDLVGYGLTTGIVSWYENPVGGTSSWEKHQIITLPEPVAMTPYDVDADGQTDIVITHDYGSCAYNCQPEDGKISWLRNPGNGTEWKSYFIGDLVAAHRIKFGHFTQSDRIELLALPIVGVNGFRSPSQVTLYTLPNDVYSDGWESTLIDGSLFHVLHGVSNKSLSPSSSLRDSVLLASEEGIVNLYFGSDSVWHQEKIASGELKQVEKTGFKGSGDVDVASIDGETIIAAIEPFHGNTVSVYNNPGDSWSRTVLDVFGDPNDAGEGVGHHVLASDLDGDQDDEILVGLRGPMPWQGVFAYKAVNAEMGSFVKERVSSSSVSRMVLADFNQDGRIDFASIGYAVPGYYIADNPQILVFLNQGD